MGQYSAVLVVLVGSFLGFTSCIDVHDFCPHNDGIFYDFKEGWKAINVTSKPNNKIRGPTSRGRKPDFNNFGGINLQEVFANLPKDRKHCLICYNFPSRKMKMSTRVLCLPNGCTLDDVGSSGCKDYEVYKGKRQTHLPGKIQIISTAIDPNDGSSEDYGCNVLAFEVVAVTKGTATMQCWMKPLPTAKELAKIARDAQN